MDQERFRTFVNSIQTEIPDYLLQLEEEALKDQVPIIRKDAQYYLRTMLNVVKPRRILEVGTAVGFSALLMREYTPGQVTITTIENYPPRIEAAKKNLAKFDPDGRITLLEGDAAEILPTLEGGFDFVFMDAAKGQYINFLPQVLRLTGEGSLIITDNVLQDGDVLESHYAVERRNRTIHKRMREYLYELCHSEYVTTDILPVGDGLAVCLRTKCPYQERRT